jgi:hypothetical protein
MMSLDLFLKGWMALAVLTFFYLLQKAAPYGRHTQTGWGPTLPNRWGWVIMEGFVLLTFWVAFFLEMSSFEAIHPTTWVLVALFNLHYIHRSFIFPFCLKTNGKRMPWAIAGSAMLFNFVNGTALGHTFAQSQLPLQEHSLFTLGLVLFIIGQAINLFHDYYLISLRKPGETGYVLPEKGFFRWLWAPNLWGEIMAWGGFACMGGTLATSAFFVWTVANLVPRALAHAKWYREKFPQATPRWF